MPETIWPPQKHRHSLVDWKISYPFHHIGLDFLAPLPTSNGCRYNLLIGDHFTKWYEAIPLPDQTAATTSDALLERWICRFGCPYSIHTDRGTNFESQLFANLLKKLEIDKTRTTAFHPQSNSVIERKNKTLLNMLAKCIDEDQTNWSVKLPYVLMAYRSSVHESTHFTPHYLVFGHEISLPLDLMYRPPPSTTPIDVHDWVSQKEAFRQAYELVRRNATAQQHRRNNLYNKRVHSPTYKEGEHVLLHYPVVQPGKSPKLSSPWRDPYEILKCLNDVNYRIKELTTGKVQVVQYDRMKRYHDPIPIASYVQTRKTTHTPGYHTSPVPDFDHSQCGQTFIPYPFVPQMTSPSPGNRPTSPLPSPTPIADHFPNGSPSATPPPLLSSARRRSLPSPTRSFDHERHTPPPVSVEPSSSSTPEKLQSSKPSPKKTTFVQSPSRLDSLIDGASHNLRQRLYSSP